MKVCPVCGSTVSEDAVFCTACGSKLPYCDPYRSTLAMKALSLIKVLLYTGTFMASSYAFVFIILTAAVIITGNTAVLDNISSDADSILGIIINLLFIGAISVFFILRRRNVCDELSLKSFPKITAPLCAVLGYSANLVFVICLGLIPWPQSIIDQHTEAYSYIGADDATLILTVLSTAVVTGIAEELAFRALPLSRLRRAFGAASSVVISAAIFAIAHPTVLSMTYTFVLGILLGALFIKFDSVLPCITVHVFFNLAACIDLPESETAVLIAAVASFILFIGSAAALFGIIPKRNKDSQINEKVQLS